jgi:UDP-perosamine 4-acetyltransferase
VSPIVVIGGGGHAKVILEILEVMGLPVAGFTDAKVAPGSRWRTFPCLGNDDVLHEVFAQGARHAIIALGDNKLRLALARRVVDLGFELVTARHPSAIVSPSARLGLGVALMAGVVLNADVSVGDNVVVNTGATVDHDGQVGDGAHLAPGSHLAGFVSVGRGALVGVGSTVGRGRPLAIGDWAVVGSGAVVIEDVAPGSMVVGNPARPLERKSGTRG